MKYRKTYAKAAVILLLGSCATAGIFAQTPARSIAPPAVDAKTASSGQSNTNPGRQEVRSEEEAAILPYYNNYLQSYHLGPEDVISVEVFGQPTYSQAGIVIPPTSRISYPLVPGGIFVGGKTVDEVAKEITKKLDEYIIDPQVMVTLVKAASARYSVLGKVATPGVKVMTRRYNLYEAIAEAGGIDKEGDKKRILLLRMTPTGGLTQTTFNFDDLMSGKTEVPYLVPGDQIVVPQKKWSLSKVMDIVGRASAFAILFSNPF